MAIQDYRNTFRIQAGEPIDTRLTVADEAARFSLPRGVVYNGLVTFQSDDNNLYVYRGANGTNVSSDWHTLGAESLIDANDGDELFIWTGTLAEYNRINNPDPDTLYNIIDDYVEGVTVEGGTGFAGQVLTNTISSSNSTVRFGAVNVLPPGLTGVILTAPEPELGDWFEISNLSGELDNSFNANGRLIQGESTDLLLDDDTASFRLTYFNITYGWVITGSN